VNVDGQPLRFERKQEAIAFQVVVPAMGNRHVSIEYRNNMNLASIDISRKNLYVVLVRRLAEFRDMTLSTWSAGRAMTKFYYRHNLDAYELVFEKAVPFLLLAAVIACLAKFIQKRTRSKHVASA